VKSNHTYIGLHRRLAVLAAAVLLGLGLSPLLATPAGAEAAVGYVRLAHLSPDTPKVDVYLSKVGDTSFKEQKFEHVAYGVVSNYLPLPVGTYAVAMRNEGAPATAAPVLSTQVTVEAGSAYTVAGVGKFAGLGLKVLTDDLTRPVDGKAKVRVIQASVATPVLDVSLANGTPIAKAVSFASTTDYQLVKPGSWVLALKGDGSSAVTNLSCTLATGSVYSLLVLDSPTGLKLELRVDARGGVTAPDGGVETGGGSTGGGLTANTSGNSRMILVAAGLALVACLFAVAFRLRRLASRRP
jgi:Domain of unknown function (DUF4397)